MMKTCKILLTFLLVLVSSFGFSQSVPSYVPTNGLVGWWGFNGNAQDGSGNGNHGTVNGATLTTDRYGNQNGAYSFDGINDDINVSGSPSLNAIESSGSFSFSTWMLMRQPISSWLFCPFNKYDPSNDGGWEIIMAANQFTYNTSSGSSAISYTQPLVCSYNFPQESWFHLTFTVDQPSQTGNKWSVVLYLCHYIFHYSNK